MLRLLRTFDVRLAAFAAVLICPMLQAKQVYVTQAGAGTGTGLSLANAGSATWFNTAGNWGSGAGQISPGDTVHLNGTFSPIGSGASATAVVLAGVVTGFTNLVGGSGYADGAYVQFSGGGGTNAAATATVVNGVVTGLTVTTGGSGYTTPPVPLIMGSGLTVLGSGVSAGNPTTILFDPGAAMQAPVWPAATGAIGMAARQFITIDGGATGTIGGPNGNPAQANGFISNTANGTALPDQTPSIFVRCSDSSNVTVQNLGLYNLYVRTSTTDLAPSKGALRDWSAATFFYYGGSGMSNILMTNCIIHDSYTGIFSQYEVGSQNFEFSFLTAYNCNWGGICGDANNSSAMSGLKVHDNYLHDFANWDDTTGGNLFHHDGFFAWAVSGGTMSGVLEYNNLVGPNFGLHTAGGLFVQGWVKNVVLYNNIFQEAQNDGPSDGLVYFNPYPDIVGSYSAYNNTFVGGGAGTGVYFGPDIVTGHTTQLSQTTNLENNLFSGVGTAIALYSISTPITINANFNLGYNLNSNLAYSYSATTTSIFQTFSQWQGLGYDASGSSQNPNLNGSYVPQAPSGAVDAGTNLSSLGVFTTDVIGTSRPQGLAWDIGAYELVQTVPVIAIQPSPQTGIFAGGATFTALAYGAPTLSYQWQVSTDGGSTWNSLQGAASYTGQATPTLTLSNLNVGLSGNQYRVVAENSQSTATSAGAALTVNPKAQTITFGALAPVSYGGAAFALGATASSGLAVGYSSSNPSVATVSGNTVTIVGGGTTTITASQAGNANYQAAASVNQTLTVNPIAQSITFNSLANQTYGGPSFSLNATASSGLAVSYSSSNSSVATVSGSTVTVVGVGTTTITATQGGNANYLAAPSVQQTLTVGQATQTVNFTAIPSLTYGGGSVILNATASTGLTVSFSSSNSAVAKINGSFLTIVSAGTVTITATQAGNVSYLPATATQTITIAQEAQTISLFVAFPTYKSGGPPIKLAATSTSNLAVVYSSSDPTVATISGNTIVIEGAGTATITASQPGNVDFLPAPSQTQTLTITGQLFQSIGNFSALPSLNFGDGPVQLSATASSGLAVIYSSSNTAVATVSGNTITIVGVGTTTITASQAGNTGYEAAASVSQVLTVSQASGAFFGSMTTQAGSLAHRTADATQGSIAAYVDGNNGTLIGYISGSGAAFLLNFTLSGGAFTGQTPTITSNATVAQSLTFNGTLSGGTLTGTIQELGLSFSATVDVPTGPSAGVAGLYSAGQTFAVVGTQNDVFVTAVAPAVVAAGTGTLGTGNTFTVQATSGATITASISSQTSAITGSIATSSGTVLDFTGTSAAVAPQILPASLVLDAGQTANLSVATTGATAYQWQQNGANISGATGPTLTIANIGGFQGGIYTALVTTSAGTLASTPSNLLITTSAHLFNVSARAYVGTGSEVLIPGFYISGTGNKQILLRGGGPVLLTNFGLTGTLPSTTLTMFDSTGTPIATDAGWNNTLVAGTSNSGATVVNATTNIFNQVYAYGYPAGSGDSAMVATVPAGGYTAALSGVGGTSGIGAVEVYDADTGTPTATLINVSARAYVGLGNQANIVGFVISGTTSETVLIRGDGPGLKQFGVTNFLATPQLVLYDTAPTALPIASNTGWNNAITPGTSKVAAGLAPATTQIMNNVYAFTLAPNSADCAIVATLPPGSYTAVLSGANGTTGVGLVEAYVVP